MLRGIPKLDTARPEFAHLLTIDGRLAGIWKRTFTPREAGIDLRALRPLARADRAALGKATKRYGAYLEVPVTLSLR